MINSTIADYHFYTCSACETAQKQGPLTRNRPFAPEDSVSISDEARNLLEKAQTEKQRLSQTEDLSQQEQKEVQKMEQRDIEVKAHEMAHVAAGGGVVNGGAHYDYQTGPDGKKYAVGGHVNIDTSGDKDPEATVRKMRQVKKAALAPANPSASDRAVAAKAARVEMKASVDMREQQTAESESETEKEDSSAPPTEMTDEITASALGGVTTM